MNMLMNLNYKYRAQLFTKFQLILKTFTPVDRPLPLMSFH